MERLHPTLSPELERDLDRAAAYPEMAQHAALLRDHLRSYAALLSSWATRVNLVSRADCTRLGTHHFLPSLSACSIINALPHRTVVDLGSGAGLPGIPLSLALQDSEFFLVESRRRRATFLRHAIRSLGLKNACTVERRFEDWLPPVPIDCIVVRGVSLTVQLLESAAKVLSPHGCLISYHAGVGPTGAGRCRLVWAFSTTSRLRLAVLRPQLWLPCC